MIIKSLQYIFVYQIRIGLYVHVFEEFINKGSGYFWHWRLCRKYPILCCTL